MRTGNHNSTLRQPSLPSPVCPVSHGTSNRGRLSGAGAAPRQGRGSDGRPGRSAPRRMLNDLVDYRTPTYLSNRYWRFRDWARSGQTNWGMNIPTDLYEEDDDRSDAGLPPFQLGGARNQGRLDKEIKIVNTDPEKKNGEKSEEKEEEEEIPPGFRWVTIEIV